MVSQCTMLSLLVHWISVPYYYFSFFINPWTWTSTAHLQQLLQWTPIGCWWLSIHSLYFQLGNSQANVQGSSLHLSSRGRHHMQTWSHGIPQSLTTVVTSRMGTTKSETGKHNQNWGKTAGRETWVLSNGYYRDYWCVICRKQNQRKEKYQCHGIVWDFWPTHTWSYKSSWATTRPTTYFLLLLFFLFWQVHIGFLTFATKRIATGPFPFFTAEHFRIQQRQDI